MSPRHSIRRIVRSCSLLSLVLVGMVGCQAQLLSFTVPQVVRGQTGFGLAVSGMGTSGTQQAQQCGCVLQLPNGFLVNGASFVGSSPVQLGPVRDDPAVLAACQAEPGHYLVAFSGQLTPPVQWPPGSAPTGTLSVSAVAPAIAQSLVTFKVAIVGEATPGVWQASDPPSAGILDFANVGGPNARTVPFQSNRVVSFGGACTGFSYGASQLRANGVPFRGNGAFALSFSNGVANAFAAIWLGVDRSTLGGFALPLDLQPFGAPACHLYVNPLRTEVLQFDGAGNGGLALPIPNDPALQDATFYAQGLRFLSGANAAGMLFTDGLSIQVL